MKTVRRDAAMNSVARGHFRFRVADTVKSNKKASLVIGGAGAVLSSGLAYWQSCQKTVGVVEDDTEREIPQFILLPSHMSTTSSEIKSLIPKHLRKPWKLLHKANTGDYEQHLNAVRELSSCTFGLCDGELRQLAQSCEGRTAVGLARMKASDLRMFLPPPPMPKEVAESSLAILFWKLLSKLRRRDDVHDCIKYFTTTALENYVEQSEDEFVHDEDLDHEFQRDTHLIMALPRRRHSRALVYEYCLVALLSHSTMRSHCQKLVDETFLLPLLIRVANEMPDNKRLKSLIGKIIANISLFPETHAKLFASGWVGLLAEWSRDSNLLVNLPATKALSNLDQDFGSCSFAPGIYLVMPSDRVVRHTNELSNRGLDIVLVHGLLGGVFYTWRQHDKTRGRSWSDSNLVRDQNYSYCWPRDWLMDEDLGDRVRVIGVDFDAYASQWGNSCPRESFKTSLKDRSKDILDKLRQCGVGSRPVIFVGHSMGGLVIKKMLVQAQVEQDVEFVNNTRAIMFFSTPHIGTQMAKLNSTAKFLFFPTSEISDLEADSPHLLSLNQDFVQLVKNDSKVKIVSFGEAQPTPLMGVDVTFVPKESADLGIGDFYQIEANHMNVCKPDSKDSIIYEKFIGLVNDVLDEEQVRDRTKA